MSRPVGPPLTPVLTIGVTGHRRLADPEGVRRRCDEVLARVGELAVLGTTRKGRSWTLRPLRLRVVSPLAEGADRVVAEAGLGAGCGLQCPLPLDRAEYERDFESAESKTAFHALLQCAESVFELDGAATKREAAYAAVGELVVRQSDVLIAVWDERPSQGRGGTAEIVESALRAGVVVVLIDPEAAALPVLISGSIGRLRRDPLSELAAQLRSTLAPESAEHRSGLGRFLDERPAAAASTAAEDWRGLYAAVDAAASRYAGLYRVTFFVNFIVSAVAVTAALVSSVQAPKTVGPLVLEIGCILLIIGLTLVARSAGWHTRWIEYRHLAEQLRPLPLLSTLGLSLPDWRPTGYARRTERSSAWADWLTLRAQRAIGLPTVRLDGEALAAVRARLLADIDDQVGYHRRSALRRRRIERRLHALGLLLFALTGLVCAAHLLELAGLRPSIPLVDRIEGVGLTVSSGALPAFGAAVLGIRNVGEFSRIAQRSSATFEALVEERAALLSGSEPLTSESLGAAIRTAVLNMMTETADWRIIVSAREIELPG